MRFLCEAITGTTQDFTEGSLSRGIALLAIPTVLEMVMESTFGMMDAFPLAWYLARPTGLGPRGVYLAVCIAESVLAMVAMAFFRRGKWKKVRV